MRTGRCSNEQQPMIRSHGWPEPGDQLPPWLPRFAVRLSRWFLNVRGWRMIGEVPNHPKQVIVAAPHTSNWDWAIGIVFVFATGVKLNWLGKHSLFKWPYGYFFRPLGGIPVDRKSARGIVAQVCARFEESDQFQLVIAAEGTRRHVDEFKTGFYRIARQAGVPIALAFIDLSGKQIGFIECPQLTGDMATDIKLIEAAYMPWSKRNR